ncbi:putative serine/threonine-protein kinase [Tritrichomonas foetus]|uniref:Serine/threonine-protein kinase n=1 Tax=Tritrichomonas foetus TaxID=1144522 RepID=A0A1J4JIR1_9EUKA|nr:putative serine/threonine-protein kinase [Tritrichomonas foetus]|eukprot:OHS97429.1 putative serine/threonine-protein kinase [Tritrichomonas foetus]
MTSLGPDFRIISKLGEGSFAEVFKVRTNRTGQFYAVKRLKKRYRSIEEVNRLPEVLFLRQLQGNPNVIKLIDLIYDQKNGYVAIVFELMDCNLYELLSEHKKPYDEDISLLLIYQLLRAVSYMHSKNMFHRDIKPENCMVDKETLCLKLCDFGSTRGVASAAPYTEYVSTRWYRAPECILTSGSYGPEVDEWAAGCMLFELLTTRPLFPGKHEIDQIAKIHNLLGTPARDVLAQFRRNPNTQISFQFPQRPAQDLHRLLPKVSQDTIDLLQRLLTYNPQDRITASDALAHPAFEVIQHYYDNWATTTDQSMPFSSYYLHVARGKNVAPRPSIAPPPTIPNPSQPDINNSMNNSHNSSLHNSSNNSINSDNVDAQDKPQQAVVIPNIAQPKPAVVIHPSNILNQQPTKPQVKLPSIIQQHPNQPQVNIPIHVQKPTFTTTTIDSSLSSKPPHNQYLHNLNQQVQPQPQPQPQIKPPPMIYNPVQPPKQPSGLSKPKVKMPGGGPPSFDPALMEARIRAAQRIKEYQEKMRAQAPRKTHVGAGAAAPFHGPAFNYAPPKQPQHFQMPKPEILKPRLPPQYKLGPNQQKGGAGGKYSHLPGFGNQPF